MRTRSLSSAALVLAVSSVSWGQTVTGTLVENFDDGAAGTRWDFLARENGLDPALGTPDGTAIFNFDYSTTNYTRWTGVAPIGSVQEPIGPAPSGGGATGVLIHVNDGQGTAASVAIAQAAITPKAFINTGDYRMTLDMFANNSNPDLTGSSEMALFGLNADATTASPAAFIVGDNLPTGGAIPTIAANQTANGYAFAACTEGGLSGDFRVYARKIAGDDGPRYVKRNATWTGSTPEPLLNSGGQYTGAFTNAEESFNSYYKSISPGNKNSDLYTGGVGKSWVKVTVEQRGRIVAYTLAGKVINTLFLPNSIGGKVSIGAYDAAASTPADTSESYFLYDNIKVDQLAPAGTNAISATDNYAHFTGGTTTSNGAATLNYLEFDTAAATLAGTGTLTLGSPVGAIYAGGAGISHSITKPLAINADTSVYVDEGSSLAASAVTWGTGVDFHKVGRGTLTLNSIRAKSLTIETGRLAVTGGVNALSTFELGYGATSAADTARLDIGKSIFAIDYSDVVLVSPPPATVQPLSPLNRIIGFLNTGFAADGVGNPQWTGAGIVTSAPELQGANYATSIYIVRVLEASTMGYTTSAALGVSGISVDGTTVLFGATFKSDFNFDGKVEFQDLVLLAQNYSASGLDPSTSWMKGDANADGNIEFQDLVLVAQTYNQSLSGLIGDPAAFAADWAFAQTLVPEPASLTVIALGGVAMGRRRRG